MDARREPTWRFGDAALAIAGAIELALALVGLARAVFSPPAGAYFAVLRLCFIADAVLRTRQRKAERA